MTDELNRHQYHAEELEYELKVQELMERIPEMDDEREILLDLGIVAGEYLEGLGKRLQEEGQRGDVAGIVQLLYYAKACASTNLDGYRDTLRLLGVEVRTPEDRS